MSSRREFLSKTITASSAFAMLPWCLGRPAFAGNGHSKPLSAYRIGTCDWSLKSPLTTASFDTAKKLGLTGLQYSFAKKGDGIDLRDKQSRETIRQTVAETGVSIASLGMAILNKMPYSTHPDSQQIVIDCIQTMALMKEEADALADRELASKVAPNVVLFGFFGKGDINGRPDLIDKVIGRFREVAPLAEKHGVTLGIESLLSEADHRRIIDSVGSPAVKVYYDTANSNRMGYDIYKEMKSLGKDNICQVHVKENRQLMGKGVIDFQRVRTVLDSIGYDDWLILEGSVPKKMDVEEAYALNSKYLATVFK